MNTAELLSRLRTVALAARPWAMLVAGSLVILAIPSSFAVANTLQLQEQARVEAAAEAALEQKFVDYYLGALDRLEPMGTQVVHDATAWARSGSSLLTAVDVTSLQSTASAGSS